MKKYIAICSFLISLGFYSCEKADPCEDVVCFNGGACSDGTCLCPTGYGGSNCNDRLAPVEIRINKIEVLRFPATEDNGAGWDLTSGPDIFPELWYGSTLIWSASEYYQNASQYVTYEFVPNTSVYMNDVQGRYTIALYDYDDVVNDWMGGVEFTPFNGTDTPQTLYVDANGGVAFRLTLSYVW